MTMRFDKNACECTLAEWLEHGPKLVRDSAVTELSITDCDPIKSVGGFYWFRASTSMAPPGCYLPPPIHALANGVYETEAKARSALVLACLQWAKEEMHRRDSAAAAKAPKKPERKPIDAKALAKQFVTAWRSKGVDEIAYEAASGTPQEMSAFMSGIAEEARSLSEAVDMARRASRTIGEALSEA